MNIVTLTINIPYHYNMISYRLVLTHASVDLCFQTYGDCLADEYEIHPSLYTCIHQEIVKEDCDSFYYTNCGIYMGCDVPFVCEYTPWCNF